MADNTVNIIIKTKADTKGIDQTNKAFARMRVLGRQMTNIGTRLSGVFALPIAGLTAMLLKNEELAKSLQPIGDAFGKIFNDLAISLIPVVKDLTPMFLDLAKGIGDLVKKFTDLTVPQKEMVLKFVVFLALLGPAIVIIGQLTAFIGTLGVIFGTSAAGVWAFVAPLVAVAAAIFAIITLVRMDEFKQVAALLYGKVGEIVTGDKARGAFATSTAYNALGGGAQGGGDTGNMIRGLLTAPQSGGGAAAPFIFNYSPAISTASQYEAQQQLKPMIEQILRQGNGR